MCQNLLIPLRIPEGHGFFNTGGSEDHSVCNHRIKVISDHPHYYLMLENVMTDEAQALVDVTQRLLYWASVRVGFSIKMVSSTLRSGIERGVLIDGSFPVLFLGNESIRPVRA